MAESWLRQLVRLAPGGVRRFLAPEWILRNPYVASKQLPLAGGEGWDLVERTAQVEEAPIPPREMWEGYGDTVDEYLELGREHVTQMLQHLRAQGAVPDEFTRVLELGCAAGRMLRFVPRPPDGEFWGVDI